MPKAKYHPPRAVVTYDEHGAPIGIVDTQREVAEAFNVSYQLVRAEWAPRMPRLPNGKYNLRDISNWKRTRKQDPSVAAGIGTMETDSAMERKRQAEARIAEANAAAKERANRLADADIVHRIDVNRYFSRIFSAFRDQLQRIPEEMKPTFPAKLRIDMAKHLKDRLDLALTTIHTMKDEIEDVGK